MSFALVLACCALGQAETQPSAEMQPFAVRLEMDDTQRRMFDPIFVRVSLTNESDRPWRIPSSVSYGCVFTFHCDPFTYVFPTNQAAGVSEDLVLQPQETWMIDYKSLPAPTIQNFDHEIWKDFFGPDQASGVLDNQHRVIEAKIAGHKQDKVLDYTGAWQNVRFSERRSEELEILREIYGEINRRLNEDLETRRKYPRVALDAPRLTFFGLSIFEPYADLQQRMLDNEDVFSPGTLKDAVQAVRLLNQINQADDEVSRQRASEQLLRFLNELPSVERNFMQHRMVTQLKSMKETQVSQDLIEEIISQIPEKAFFKRDYHQYLREN